MKAWRHKSVIRLIEESNNNDPIDEIRNRARNLVLTALEKGWSGPPFNATQLSAYLGIDILPNDSVLDARLLSNTGKKTVIEYNPFQKPTRINFSVAHEIAHTFFSDFKDEMRNREEEPTENKELEQLCNIGASEIQLPYAIFSNDANSIEEITIENLIALATKYKASLESVFIRFVEVINQPCATMICTFKGNKIVIDYSKGSRSFDEIIPKNFVIPKDSKAYECSVPGWSARETVHWDFLNKKYDVYCIGISPLRRDNQPRVGILMTHKLHSTALQDKKIKIEFGDATKPRGNGIKVIAQVVNTSGGLGLGFGKSLSKNFPDVKSSLQQWHEDKKRFQLGSSQLVKISEDLYVFQMLAQKGLFEKNGEIPLKYSYLRTCLISLQNACEKLHASVHMPMIGAGQAKGDWNVIQGIIFDELVNKDIDVNIYVFPGKVPAIKNKSSLTLFDEQSTWRKEK
ncbi:ImmA/IrrE family metallo-endopeptidase [Mucilaginibacter ginsenosidivorans]|uniref:ImmA/IrrE family metallo-endopeptidase n=1 Tax=Mucilaginibacter ginsenosidivorans TaxID=398053 RepID=A0A5B8URS8_9SPHI|nr:ImmA/IrrE family metallo-endopeptidase [Mucilaginibacter ginsenosidivorans]QEC61744.1 ImmA/IrrE family metallo-endopeptidase [Mucilaginibacter ginsenosidivorans]